MTVRRCPFVGFQRYYPSIRPFVSFEVGPLFVRNKIDPPLVLVMELGVPVRTPVTLKESKSHEKKRID